MTDIKLIQLDPSPPAKRVDGAEGNGDADAFWKRASQVSIVGLFVIAAVWGTYAAQHIIVPILLAWAIATIVLPLVKGLQNWGVPRVLAAIAVTLLFLCIIMTLLLVLSAPVTYWLGRATYVGALIREKLESFSQPLALLQQLQKGFIMIGSGGETTLKVDAQSSSVASTILSVVTPAIGEFTLFVGTLVFYLIFRQNLRSAVVFFLNNREARLTTVRALNDIDDNMTTYFGTFTLVNLCLGVTAATLTWATGLPNPVLWGVLACVLNYVPYIGPALVVGTLAFVGLLVHPTVGEAAMAPLLYLAVVTVEGQFITPALMGKRLELNPFAVFIAIAFFAWLWGPIGAFLAVPILMAGSVIFGRVFEEEKPDLPT
jgi:predicted PurR-regulated permease PerM